MQALEQKPSLSTADIPVGSDYFVSILASMRQMIAVIDATGHIEWVNSAWKKFAAENGGDPDKTWRRTNYFDVCSASADSGDRDGRLALNGIETVVKGDEADFYFEYPCHSPDEMRWFMMRFCALEGTCEKRFIVTHDNITKRKMAELELEKLSVSDQLTGIANRRRFDEFIDDEWRRAKRLGNPISLALFDIDFFKRYNDNHGHPAGDECLRRVGGALNDFARRPGDLIARYGGEEFAAVFGNTDGPVAHRLAERIRRAIEGLAIPHGGGAGIGCVTVSVGIATLEPAVQCDASPADLVKAADKALYQAKNAGRNRVCALDPPPDTVFQAP